MPASSHQGQPSTDSGKDDQVVLTADHKQSSTSSWHAASPSDSSALDMKPSVNDVINAIKEILIKRAPHFGAIMLAQMLRVREERSTSSSEDRIEMPERQAAVLLVRLVILELWARPVAKRKRALLCGVTYSGGKNRLKGPVNDVKKIKDMLIKHFGYTKECIRVLKEDKVTNGKDPSTTPTKKNIQDSLKWLVKDSKSGDSLVFYYSGHCRRPHSKNDAAPHDSENNTSTNIGSAETHGFCLVDCTGKYMIPNSYINSTVVRPLKKGVTLYAIVDACHSGSILDLKYTYKQQSNATEAEWIDMKKSDDHAPSLEAKGTSGGFAICLSACGDDKMTSDTNANSSRGKGKEIINMGTMTYHLIQTIDESGDPAHVTFEDILKKMHDSCHVTKEIRKPLTSKSLQMLRENQKMKELPVLSSSFQFQVSKKKFLQ